ncbi:MAG TPA: hypothetical protein VFM65_06500 [Flavobacteriaceae bacterium]|nr:hypothetical protein [Flavobacteriaceae bacterium]
MMEFDQYLGFLVFLLIFTAGFWLMLFLTSIIPYWIGGSLMERMKEKKATKKREAEIEKNKQ